MSGNPNLDEKIKEWLKWDKNEHSLESINQMLDAKHFDQLAKLLLHRLTFGTAGIRGRMQPGYAGMNDLVIIQTGQGLVKYLEQYEKDLLEQNGIVIGYDGRHNSKRFAELTAAIFINRNHKVHLFGTVVPTPFVPFTVGKYKCAAGIVITASHNPKDDNGYKVYASNAVQIISPADKLIQEEILKNLEPLSSSWDTSIIQNSKYISDPLDDILPSYVEAVSKELVKEHVAINKKSNIKVTYTAMHGVGYNYIKSLFDVIGVQVIPVVEQKDPDPEFPTVKFPNPEEGKSSLDLSFKTADANNSNLILANDPDADRLAVAEKDGSGEWKVFNGNELGALLGWWCFHCHQTKYPNEPLQNAYMLASTVSSKILKSMGDAEGFNFVETLTGFKWMGNKSYELLKQGKRVIFAFEEAIGFMCGSVVLDKDGISAAAHMATMALYLYHHGLTLNQQLSEIYQEYGYHVSCDSYFICNDPEKIKKIFERLRNYNGANTYPQEIIDGKYKICGIRDLTTGFDSNQPDQKAILPVSKSSQMITFNFKNGLVATIRTSGTEPKIKYYTELCASPTQTDVKEIEHTLKEMVDGIIFEFLQPVENNLLPKSD